MKGPIEKCLPEELKELKASRKNGDLLEAIYLRYYEIVFSICLGMTRNRADAEDLAHDTFIQIYRDL